MAPKTLSEAEKRTYVLQVRLNASERALLAELCGDQPQSSYARERILERPSEASEAPQEAPQRDRVRIPADGRIGNAEATWEPRNAHAGTLRLHLPDGTTHAVDLVGDVRELPDGTVEVDVTERTFVRRVEPDPFAYDG